MYTHIEQKLAQGSTIILDGGTGTQIQKHGAPMDSATWCAAANLNAPDAVRSTHEDYIRAGAEVITANTYATSPLLFSALGRQEEIFGIDRAALKLAREACRNVSDRPIAIAGSLSIMRPVTAGGDRTAPHDYNRTEITGLLKRKAGNLAKAGCDLIIMEMMRGIEYSLIATEAAVATGLPVWVGISVERQKDGRLMGFGQDRWSLGDIVPVLMSTGAKACLVMHSNIDVTADALQIVKSNWAGPVGTYPESGVFEMPNWVYSDVTPEDFVVQCGRWRQLGASILGGCCGIGPDHIRALAKAYGEL